MAFSSDLQQLRDLEEQYREKLAAYQAEVTAYKTLLEHDSQDPSLPQKYEVVEGMNQAVQDAYNELERLRRRLSPGPGASSSYAS